MGWGNIFILNLYSTIILLILGFHVQKNGERKAFQDKLFLVILYFTVFMLCIDTLSRFDGMAFAFFPAVNAIGNFTIFLLVPVIPSLWLAYVHFQTFRKERKTKNFLRFLGFLNLVYIVFFLVSQHFDLLYSINENNIYQRAPLYFVPVLFTILLLLWAMVIPIRHRERMVRKEFFSIIFFAIPPVIGIILQIMFYGTSLILSGVVLSLLVIFFNIQTHGMHTDYLTGVNNRKMLDAYLKEKINQCNEQNTFAAILLDINDFKHINDTYGHSVGDNALENAAELLRQSLRIGDFVARFGGDEFCIITDISEDMDLDITVHRIYKNLNKFNASNSHAYKLSFSMGYAAYDYHLQMSAEEFLKQIDALMYEDKSIHKRNFCFSKNRR